MPQTLRQSIGQIILVGSGFLTDAFDLFIINICLSIIAEVRPVSAEDKSLISAVALFGAMIGQLVLGALADRLGRTVLFRVTLGMITLGTVASALSVNAALFSMMAVARFLMGVGIGGEYPLSSTIAVEISDEKSRPTKMAAIFSMQGVGIFLAASVGYLFIATVPLQLAWRLCLGFPAIPGAIMFFFRLRMEETDAFAKAKQGGHTLGFWGAVKEIGRNHKRRLFGTAIGWFLLDVVFYANGLFTTTILKAYTSTLQENVEMNMLLAFISMWGYYFSICIVRFSRKWLQTIGFILMGILYIVIGSKAEAFVADKLTFIILYSLTFFLSNIGPNTTTYILAASSYPTHLRATCAGLSAATGKLGAVVGAYAMPSLLDAYGLGVVFMCCGGVSMAGALVTLVAVQDKWDDVAASPADKPLLDANTMPSDVARGTAQ